MEWNRLSKKSQDYVDRYIRSRNMTREEALQEKIVQVAIEEYEKGCKRRLIFA